VALLSLASTFFSQLREGDPDTPTGRFALLTSALPYFPQLMAATALAVYGGWKAAGRGPRWAAWGALGALGLASLGLFYRVIQDAGLLAHGVPAAELMRFRLQVVRGLLYFGTVAGISSLVLLKAGRRIED
jgi:hypothetical protein